MLARPWVPFPAPERIKTKIDPGVAVHAFNPSCQAAEAETG